jgi:hypothetical protein
MNDLLTGSILAIRATTAEVNSARPDSPVVPAGTPRVARPSVRARVTLADWLAAAAERVRPQHHDLLGAGSR